MLHCLTLRRFFMFVFFLAVMQFVEAQRVVTRNEIIASSGATAVRADGASFSGTLGLSAFVVVGDGGETVEFGVQHVFCITATDTVRTTVCQGDTAAIMAVLPMGAKLGADVDPSREGVYETEYRLTAQDGCDSIVMYEITVLPVRDTVIAVQSEGAYLWGGKSYEVSGDYVSVTAGSNGCDSVMRLHLVVVDDGMIPEIYHHQRRVVMVNHNASGAYRQWAAYRWYRNGVLVGEGRDSYKEDGRELDGCFQLEVPTDSTLTTWVRSEELCLGDEAVVTDDVVMTVEPNPVRRGGTLTFYIDAAAERLMDGRVMIYDVQGRTMADVAASRQVSVVAGFATGVYTAHVMLTDGTHICRKILVR